MQFFSRHWADILLLAVVGYSASKGWRRGFAVTFFEFGGLVVSMIGAALLYAPFGEALFLRAHLQSRAFSKAMGYVAVWVLLTLLYMPIAKRLERKVPKAFERSATGRVLGVATGVLDGILICAFFFSFMIALPFSGFVKKDIMSSASGRVLVERSESLVRTTDAALGGAFRETLTFITVLQDAQETVDLGFSTEEFRQAADLERRIFDLVNAERTKRGLAPYALDERMSVAARTHGMDMLRRGYFSHVSPDGRTPDDRATAAGAVYRVFSENIASAPDVTIAHTGFMNSPGHRANILSQVYGRIGVGVMDAGIYGIMVTQAFAD